MQPPHTQSSIFKIFLFSSRLRTNAKKNTINRGNILYTKPFTFQEKVPYSSERKYLMILLPILGGTKFNANLKILSFKFIHNINNTIKLRINLFKEIPFLNREKKGGRTNKNTAKKCHIKAKNAHI